MLPILFCCLLAACGADPSVTTTGTGGSGGDTCPSHLSNGECAWVTGSGGAGGVQEVVLGPSKACAGALPLAPIDGEAQDENGADIHEDGALACHRFRPPSYPFHFTSLNLSWTIGGPCYLDPVAVYFLAPVDAFKGGAAVDLSDPSHHLTPFDPSGPSNADGSQAVDLDLDVKTDWALYGCARLAITDLGRTCVSACKGPKDIANPDAFYSNTNPAGTITPLPFVDLEGLAVSPTVATGAAFGNERLDLNMSASGHPMTP